MQIFGLGIQELLIILLIILLLFGAKKLPQLARSMGESVRELRSGFSDDPHRTNQKSETEKIDQKS